MLQKNKPTGGTFNSLAGHLATGQWHEVHHSAKTCLHIVEQIQNNVPWWKIAKTSNIWSSSVNMMKSLFKGQGWKWIQEALTYQRIKRFLKGLTIWYVLYVLLWMKHEYEICTFLFTFYTASQLFWKFTYICAFTERDALPLFYHKWKYGTSLCANNDTNQKS